MTFIYQSNNSNAELNKSKIIWRAYQVIITFPMKGAEQILDQYLRENHKVSLKQACIQLLSAIKVGYDFSNNYIISFPIKKLDKLASLITYGDGKILGSDILKTAFASALK